MDMLKHGETNPPECSQEKLFFLELSHFNSLFLPWYCTKCRLWIVEWGGVQREECEDSDDSGVFVMCSVWSARCQVKVKSVECKV